MSWTAVPRPPDCRPVFASGIVLASVVQLLELVLGQVVLPAVAVQRDGLDLALQRLVSYGVGLDEARSIFLLKRARRA